MTGLYTLFGRGYLSSSCPISPSWMIALRTAVNSMNHVSRSVLGPLHGLPLLLTQCRVSYFSAGDHSKNSESSSVVPGKASKISRSLQALLLSRVSARSSPVNASKAVFRYTSRSG